MYEKFKENCVVYFHLGSFFPPSSVTLISLQCYRNRKITSLKINCSATHFLLIFHYFIKILNTYNLTIRILSKKLFFQKPLISLSLCIFFSSSHLQKHNCDSAALLNFIPDHLAKKYFLCRLPGHCFP